MDIIVAYTAPSHYLWCPTPYVVDLVCDTRMCSTYHQVIKDDCQKDLDEAMPAYKASIKALDKTIHLLLVYRTRSILVYDTRFAVKPVLNTWLFIFTR
jgi:hypothetical protein